MTELFDVFFCYRRAGAQTAKLLKRHWKKKGWPGEIWYSDGESHGNFKRDISPLIGQAESVVMFLSEHFTAGFTNILDSGTGEECITAHEVIAIARKKLEDEDFRIVTINLDGYTLTPEDTDVLRRILAFGGLPEECANFFTQCNRNVFHTAWDDEDVFFDRIAEHLLPDEFYRDHMTGNFSFGPIATTVDLIIWDKEKSIHPEAFDFQSYGPEIEFYRALKKAKVTTPQSVQNDQMISVVRCTPTYQQDKELHVEVAYQAIDYHLFERGIFLRKDGRLGINRQICQYQDRSAAFPIPNAMGMAIMVVTADGKIVFSRRSSERRIRPLEYDCSIVEGMKFSDQITVGGQDCPYSIDDPEFVEYEFRRAYLEEMCPDDSDIRIRISGVILDKEYAQWNLVGTIFTDKTEEELRRMSAQRRDSYETRSLYFVPYVDEEGRPSLRPIAEALAEYRAEKMWSTVYAALYAALIQLGFSDREIAQYPWR